VPGSIVMDHGIDSDRELGAQEFRSGDDGFGTGPAVPLEMMSMGAASRFDIFARFGAEFPGGPPASNRI